MCKFTASFQLHMYHMANGVPKMKGTLRSNCTRLFAMIGLARIGLAMIRIGLAIMRIGLTIGLGFTYRQQR